MNKKYFLYCTIYGLIMIPIVAFYIMGNSAFWFLSFPALYAIIAGYLAALLAARFVDRHSPLQPSLLCSLIAPVLIFTFGVACGSLVNLLVQGQLFNPVFGHFREIKNWFLKPAYWLLILGAPCAVMVGFSYYVARRYLFAVREKIIP